MIGALDLGSSEASLMLDLNRNQHQLSKITNELSTGLRINTSSDDPSGFSISTNLQTIVKSLDVAANNLQTGVNYADVASGAVQSVIGLLQQMRVLAVEANSSILSTTDRNNIQTEFSQLQAEINAIDGNTVFNNNAVFVLQNPPPAIVVGDAGFETPVTGPTSILDPGGTAWTFTGDSGITGNGSAFYHPAGVAPSGVQTAYLQGGGGVITQTLSGFVGSATYTVSVDLLRPNTTAGTESVDIKLGGTDLGTYTVGAGSTPAVVKTQPITVNSPSAVLQFTAVNGGGGNSLLLDAVKIGVQPIGLSDVVQAGSAEGNTIAVPVLTASANYLAIANLNLAAGQIGDPSTGPTLAVTTIDAALENILSQATQVGSFSIALTNSLDNDNLASLNLQAAESNIRDLNVATAISSESKQQLLISFGTGILAQGQVNAEQILQLFR